MKVPRDLDIFLSVHGQEAVCVHAGRGAVAGEMQHGGPEQGVEIEDVFADEVVHLGLAVGFEVFVEIDADAVAQVFKRRHVADGRVQPDVEVFARCVGDFKTEIRRVAGDVPVGQGGFFAFAQPFFHFVEGFGLQMGLAVVRIVAGSPCFEEVGAFAQFEEEVFGFAQFGFGTGNGGIRINQFGRGIGRAADFAVVAVLVVGVAFGAFAFDEAVGQEHLFFGVEKLLDDAAFNFAVGFQRTVNVLGKLFVFRGMGAVIIVVADAETGKVGEVLFAHFGNHVFRRNALFLRGKHHGRAVGVVGAAVVAFVAAQFLEAYPNVGLDVFDHVAEVDAAVGIRQRGSDKDFACHGLCF